MYLRTSKVTSNGQITVPAEFLEKMNLTPGDLVAFMYESNRMILRKLTSGDGQMTFEEHLLYRDIVIKNKYHEKLVKLFYKYAASVTGDSHLYPDLLGRLLNIDLSSSYIKTACDNGIKDGTNPPYDDVDIYVKFDNDILVYIYGSCRIQQLRELEQNEYVLMVLGDDLNGQIERKSNRHIYIN